ncbi:MAG: long-chain fatty acid--CoA ligase, partial [Luminiphilus sp.]
MSWFPSLHCGGDATALVDGDRALSYDQLHEAVNRVIAGLLDGAATLDEERVAFLYPASFDYAA